MANTYSAVSSLVGKQIVQSLSARDTLTKTVNTSYAKDYQNGSYVPGETVNIEIEDQPNVVSGLVANVRDLKPRTTSVTIAGFNTSIKIGSLKKGYSSRDNFIRKNTDAMVRRLVREIASTGYEYMAKNTGNNVGTVGTDISSAEVYAEGRAMIEDQLAPGENSYVALSPSAKVALTASLKGAPNPKLSNAFVSARMQNMYNMNFYSTPSIYRYTAGTTTDMAGAVTTTSVNGATTLVLKSLGTGTITAGTKLTVAAVYAVDPETKATLPYLKQFSVLTSVTIDTNAATVTLNEPIYDSTTGQQNVDALPQADAVVTIIGTGTASQTGTSNIIYDKDAFTFVGLPLPVAMDGTESIVRSGGIVLRTGVSAKDHINDTEIIKVSALWGWGKLRPNHACVAWGK